MDRVQERPDPGTRAVAVEPMVNGVPKLVRVGRRQDGEGWDEVITGLEAWDREGRRLWRVDGQSDQYTTLQVGDLLPQAGLEVVIGEYGHAGTDRGLCVNGLGDDQPFALRLELSQNTHSATVGRFLEGKPQEQLLVRNNTHTGREGIRDHRIVERGAGSRRVRAVPLERRALPAIEGHWQRGLQRALARKSHARGAARSSGRWKTAP